MHITKCDICKKQLKDRNDSVRAGIGLFREKDLCPDCGKPILNFLKKHKLIKEEKK